jgi:hypothetical protein
MPAQLIAAAASYSDAVGLSQYNKGVWQVGGIPDLLVKRPLGTP